MKWGWYWTPGSSAFKRFSSRNLLGPSCPSCFPLLQTKGSTTDAPWLLSQILRWKGRPLARYGWAIEFWVSTQRCVCAGGLVCSSQGGFRCLSRRGREERQEGQEHAQEDKEDNNEAT